MSYQITVEQVPAGNAKWRFTATIGELDAEGKLGDEYVAEVEIAAMSGMQDNELFLQGARMALARLEAENA